MHRGKAKILGEKSRRRVLGERGGREEFFWIERNSSWNDLMRRETSN